MLNNNRIKLKTSESGQPTGLIIKTNDSAVLSYIGYAIEQHLDTIQLKLKPRFQEILVMSKSEKKIWKDHKMPLTMVTWSGRDNNWC